MYVLLFPYIVRAPVVLCRRANAAKPLLFSCAFTVAESLRYGGQSEYSEEVAATAKLNISQTQALNDLNFQESFVSYSLCLLL